MQESKMSDFYSFSIETNEGSTCMATSATRSKKSVRGGGGRGVGGVGGDAGSGCESQVAC